MSILATRTVEFLRSHPRAGEAIVFLKETNDAADAKVTAWERANLPHPDPSDTTPRAQQWRADRERVRVGGTFVRSVYDHYRRYGFLSEAQLLAVLRSMDGQAVARPPAPSNPTSRWAAPLTRCGRAR